jgi:hypothetical protein
MGLVFDTSVNIAQTPVGAFYPPHLRRRSKHSTRELADAVPRAARQIEAACTIRLSADLGSASEA